MVMVQNTPQLTPEVGPTDASTHPYGHDDPAELSDPRSSSTQSLRPIVSPSGHDKRILLLVYIHGFLGAEASFQSFPAHVHSLLTITLTESHVIHTKIYPRYQSRRNIAIARDDFSKWLSPHESSRTDVIILGHSLGGILGAEIVLQPAGKGQPGESLRHRILGHVAFDTPFLGLNPGVILTGIASLFKPAAEELPPELQDLSSNNSSEVFDLSQDDPNYNPAYPNDVHRPVRKNTWDRAWYFWNKHANHLGKAAKSYVKSYFEFGGCLADYPGLRRRYGAIRALEDVDELQRPQISDGRPLRRVRFVNYYTASTGAAPKSKETAPIEAPEDSLDTETTPGSNDGGANLLTNNGENQEIPPQQQPPVGISNVMTPSNTADEKRKEQHSRSGVGHDSEKLQIHHFTGEGRHTLSSTAPQFNVSSSKERKFCSLPADDPKTKQSDATWVKVSMSGVDEVVAHTSLFIVSDVYAQLVGDTAERISGWVHEAETMRMLLAEQLHV